METYSFQLLFENYHVLYHPHVKNFIIFEHRFDIYVMVKSEKGWRCLNNKTADLRNLPVQDLYNECLKTMPLNKSFLISSQIEKNRIGSVLSVVKKIKVHQN